MSVSTEFFKTLAEAEYWAKHDMKHLSTEVYSLDKPGTVLAFISEKDNSLWNECRGDAKGSRAVVKIWR